VDKQEYEGRYKSMIAEIVAIELTKTKAGANAVKIVIKTTDGTWLRDFIGESAPSFVIDRYWKMINLSRGWAAFASLEAFDLVRLKVEIKTKEGDYGEEVTDIKLLGQPTTSGVIDDDIPF